MTMNNMKEELKQVRYYYAKKDHFDKIENEIDIKRQWFHENYLQNTSHSLTKHFTTK